MLISSYDGGTCTHVPLGYVTVGRLERHPKIAPETFKNFPVKIFGGLG